MKTAPICCPEYAQISRRAFLGHSLPTLGGLLFSWPRWPLAAGQPRLALADPHVGPRGDTLVCIFLRGGADGLNIVVPYGDDRYYAHRPTIAIPRPDDQRSNGRTLPLDGFFGLHPALSPLLPIYQAGHLTAVHATGSPDESRSHFEAMDLMERGAVVGDYSGWLARHLMTLDTGNQSALRAIGVGDMLPASLSGAVSATPLSSIAEYHLQGRPERVGEMQAVLQAMYAQEGGGLTAVADQTFATLSILQQLNNAPYQPRGRAYPDAEFGRALQTTAQLLRADVGVEVACLDFGGWDTHVAQGSVEGVLARQLTTLAAGLAAFYEDLADGIGRVTVVVMSEFGRRVAENGGLGTDHGHGNMMLLLGGGLVGGQVYARWPGLQPEQLTGPGDLTITTDYRDVLGELLRRRLNNPALADVFPGYTVQELGLAVDL